MGWVNLLGTGQRGRFGREECGVCHVVTSLCFKVMKSEIAVIEVIGEFYCLLCLPCCSLEWLGRLKLTPFAYTTPHQ